MLHIILGILKVIGAILLVLLGLVVLLLLAALFVPVCYRLEGKSGEPLPEAKIRVSWLFRIFGAEGIYREKRFCVRLKLFGLVLKRFGEEEKTGSAKQRSKMRKTHGFGEREKEEELAAGNNAGENTAAENTAGEPATEDTSAEETVMEDDLSEETWLGEEMISGKALLTEDPSYPSSEHTVSHEHPGGQDKRRKYASVWRSFVKLVKRAAEIPSFLLSLPQRLLDLADQAGELLDRWDLTMEGMEKTKEEWYRKAKPFLTDRSKALYRRLLGHLKYLIKHYGPSKVEGWIRFGTGSPDSTGELTGLIYLILPPSAGRLELMPEFTEKVLEGDMKISGHIRLWHTVKIAFLLWRDRQLRGLIRKVRAKGGQ